MSHISSIGAAIYTDLAVAFGTTTSGVASANVPVARDKVTLDALFNTTSATALKYLQVPNIREFPAMGAQPNLVNVPVFGQKTTQSIGGQSDAPSFEVTVNFVGTDWAKGVTSTTWLNNVVATKGNELANMVGDGVARVWRVALMTAPPTGAVLSATQSQYDSNAGGLGKTENSIYYFVGKLESMLVTPSLTDATTATLAFSIVSDFYGAYTV